MRLGELKDKLGDFLIEAISFIEGMGVHFFHGSWENLTILQAIMLLIFFLGLLGYFKYDAPDWARSWYWYKTLPTGVADFTEGSPVTERNFDLYDHQRRMPNFIQLNFRSLLDEGWRILVIPFGYWLASEMFFLFAVKATHDNYDWELITYKADLYASESLRFIYDGLWISKDQTTWIMLSIVTVIYYLFILTVRRSALLKADKEADDFIEANPDRFESEEK